MPRVIDASLLPSIRSALKLYRVSSIITGTFLLLLMITWGLRRIVGYELWGLGPNGIVSLEPYVNEGEGLPTTGFNLTVAILVVHGWLYVLYLFADFRLWTLMRWSFFRFLVIAAGGIVPFLSFFAERHFAKVAEKEIAESAGVKN